MTRVLTYTWDLRGWGTQNILCDTVEPVNPATSRPQKSGRINGVDVLKGSLKWENDRLSFFSGENKVPVVTGWPY